MSEDEIDKIIKEMMASTQAERAKAAEYDKLSPDEKRARNRGFANALEYRNWLAQQKGFANHAEHLNQQAQQRGFANEAEYKQNNNFKNGKGTGLSMAESKNSAQYLGIFIAERLLPKIFQEPKMMPYGNRGYDAICKNGHKIDVKSSLLRKANFWEFHIHHNNTANIFVCIGFSGSRDNLVVKHIWLFSGNEILRGKSVNELERLVISDTEYSLSRVAQYDLTDKVGDANNICMLFKKGELK